MVKISFTTSDLPSLLAWVPGDFTLMDAHRSSSAISTDTPRMTPTDEDAGVGS